MVASTQLAKKKRCLEGPHVIIFGGWAWSSVDTHLVNAHGYSAHGPHGVYSLVMTNSLLLNMAHSNSGFTHCKW